ncbi:ATP-binding protein [Saccharolobus solfataricus]|uniref:Endonuclease GajA/Old nuclease/RecF-like AAA domain-containing protein n=3 Tax=Saccharolobus solfataricus TaxID=2287 RepID=Q97TV0_SACS2|nr:ATP-binding protein [Saccharolobus solfataricus]AAK41915.1 Hypothetical protein SSO1710 [Saccharolobus solfataricus P2]AAK41983.1 Hypothetical protein SSO1789 [Saccharolobus solfataricus P2]AKA74641.1 ATP-binding protein [Saccharolobus solfataricus]AKA77335.1 ATP-binding protein [Saccharolobus solfataricus]AKA80026.1 ATP-binding protein [Saccharolobus solfataricus]
MEMAIYCGKTYSWANELCSKPLKEVKVVDYNSVVDWVNSQKERAFLIFGTDVIPYSLYEYPKIPVNETPLFKFMERGGVVIWTGDVPFFYIEKDGIKKELFSKGNPFPFKPISVMGHKPLSEKSENSIVGEMLKYDPKDSWRPVEPHPLLIPISIVKSHPYTLYSTWIYKYGKGAFVRLYDSPYVNTQYILSLPERLSSLGIGIRISNFRRFRDFKMIFPEFKIGVILGKNNVGKTTILEAIAMLGKNEDKIRKFRGNISTEIAETELFVNYTYYKAEFSYSQVNRSADVNVLLIYSHDIDFVIDDKVLPYVKSSLRKVTELLNSFDPNIFYVYLSSGNELRVLFNDRTDVSINELGYGYKSLLNFILLYVIYQPRIILIDDLEGFALHPDLLKMFYDLLLKIDVDLILITTQSSDIYAYLAEKRSDKVRFILINDDKYEVLTSEEVLDRLYYEDLRYTALKIH